MPGLLEKLDAVLENDSGSAGKVFEKALFTIFALAGLAFAPNGAMGKAGSGWDFEAKGGKWWPAFPKDKPVNIKKHGTAWMFSDSALYKIIRECNTAGASRKVLEKRLRSHIDRKMGFAHVYYLTPASKAVETEVLTAARKLDKAAAVRIMRERNWSWKKLGPYTLDVSQCKGLTSPKFYILSDGEPWAELYTRINHGAGWTGIQARRMYNTGNPASPPPHRPLKEAFARLDESFASDIAKYTSPTALTEAGVSMRTDDFGGIVLLSDVQSKDAGKGRGTRAMEEVCRAADRHGVKLGLVASPFGPGAMPKKKLEEFYNRFGFAVDGDKDRMVRRPKIKAPLIQGLSEAFYKYYKMGGKFAVPDKDNVQPIYKNPSSRELAEMARAGVEGVRAIVVGDDFYAWEGYIMHAWVRDQLKELRKGITIQFLPVAGKIKTLEVTESARNTQWDHNPGTAAALLSCSALKSVLSPPVVITYYDQSTVGDWVDLKEAFHASVASYWRAGPDGECPVYKNPTRAEMRGVAKIDKEVRGIVVKDDVYVWSAALAMHSNIKSGTSGLRDGLPIEFTLRSGKIWAIAVTEYVTNGGWHHVKDVEKYLRACAGLRPFLSNDTDITMHHSDDDSDDDSDDFNESRFGAASKTRRVMYHGTAEANLRSILSAGLRADVKKKNWDKDDNVSAADIDRTSLGGVYWTKNLLTATGAARNGRYGAGGYAPSCVVVAASLETRAMVHDEDNFSRLLARIPQRGLIDDAPKQCLELYVQWKYGKKSIGVPEAREEYAAKVLATVKWNASLSPLLVMQKRDPKAVKELLAASWDAALTRLVGHLNTKDNQYVIADAYKYAVASSDPEAGRAAEEYAVANWKQLLPSPMEGERVYKSFIDKTTKSLKNSVAASIDRGGLGSARTPDSVGYSGSNKIVGVCVIRNREDGDGDSTNSPPYVTVEMKYGKMPDDFFSQLKAQIGTYAVVESTAL